MRECGGVYRAIVTDNVDPNNSGRVKVRLPELCMSGCETWARVAILMAGNDRGTWLLPDVGDEVLVAFEGGDAQSAYVIGLLWSKNSLPLETMGNANNQKLMRSRNGVKITMHDESGEENFVIETPGGQKVSLKDELGSVEIADTHGNSLALDTNGITVKTPVKVTINASLVEVNSGQVNVNAGMSKFSGVVQCDTLISNSVVSATYTPGVGNIS